MIVAKLNGTIVVDTIVVDVIPEGYVLCPEWVGLGMDINTPQPEVIAPTPEDPAEKLRQFLIANPDVSAILTQET